MPRREKEMPRFVTCRKFDRWLDGKSSSRGIIRGGGYLCGPERSNIEY